MSEIKSKFEASAEVYNNERFVHFGDQMLENYLKVFHTPKEKSLISDIWKSRDHIAVRLLRFYHHEAITVLRLTMKCR